MSASGFTPIQLYRTSTASAAPSAGNLAAGELAINLTDEKLFFKNAGGTVKVLASSGTSSIGGSNTQVQYNNNGVLGGSSNFVFDGTNVGIGTSSPAYKLDVSGTFRTTGIAYLGDATTTLIASIGNSASSGVKIIQFQRASGTGDNVNIQGINTGIGAADIGMQVSGGNVGIGTASPGAKFHVSGSEVRLQGSASFYSFYDTAGTTRSGYIQNNAGSIALVGELAQPMTFWTSNAERMRIISDGRVLVGTSTSPNGTAVSLTLARPGDNGLNLAYNSGGGGGASMGTITGAGLAFYTYTGVVGSESYTERMRIDSSGNVGIGTTAALGKLQVASAGAGASEIVASNTVGVERIHLVSRNTAGNSYIQSQNSTCLVGTYDNYSMQFLTNNTERMRIDTSGNVGIGTSSPTTKLQVNGGVAINGATFPSSGVGMELIWDGTQSVVQSYSRSGGAYQPLWLDGSFVRVNTNGTEKMRIDSSGNVGIGITTPVSYAGYGNLTVNGTSGGTLTLRNSANTNSSEMAATASEVYLKSVAATPLWFGTNNTEKMRITSAGDVGIGTATPDIFGRFYTRTVGINSSGTSILQINGTTYGGIDLGFNGTRTATMLAETGGFYLQTTTASAMSLGTNSVERMRIDSSGNVGIGTASPSFKLDVQGNSSSTATVVRSRNNDTSASSLAAFNCSTGQGVNAEWYSYSGANWFGTKSNHPQIFITNNTERARIDSSGNVLINRSSDSGLGKLNVEGGADITGGNVYLCRDTGSVFVGTTVEPSGVGTSGVNIQDLSGTAGRIFLGKTASGAYDALANYHNGTYVGGVVYSDTATSFPTSSDIRLKHDIVDAPEASSLIDAIQVRSFKWNADNTEQRYGFVAQELVTVAPEAVSQPEDPEGMMGVDYSKLVPMLVKEIQSMRLRLAQLEGN